MTRALPVSLVRRMRTITAKAALGVASGLTPFPGLRASAGSVKLLAEQAAMIERLKAAHILASAAHAQTLCADAESGALVDDAFSEPNPEAEDETETEPNCTSSVIENAARRAALDARMTRFEIERVTRALTKAFGNSPSSPEARVVLLKGGAYVALESEAAKGRRLSDLDILVSEEDLVRVEAALLDAGWAFDEKTHNPYDQAYYRVQMHELPPLRHTSRRTLVDVHFRLMPRRARFQLDHKAMMQSANRLPDSPLMVLAADDAVIYAASHAFLDGSFETPLRSLLELYTLTKYYTQADISRLYARSEVVGGEAAISIMAALLSAYLGSHTPFRASLESGAVPRANKAMVAVFKMRAALKRRYLWPAKLVLWARGHWLRAPVGNMLKHLGVKFLRRIKGASR